MMNTALHTTLGGNSENEAKICHLYDIAKKSTKKDGERNVRRPIYSIKMSVLSFNVS